MPTNPEFHSEEIVQRVGELFCGPGGFAAGAQLANRELAGLRFEHVWASDFDSDSCRTYEQNIGELNKPSIYQRDVRNLEIDALESIDGFTFGFPCNDFSSVGKQLGVLGKFGGLYKFGIDVLRAKQPKWFVAENVSGLRSPKNLHSFEKILAEMIESGYNVTPHLFKFEEYGVPQNRHRIIVVGFRDDLGLRFQVPAPSHNTPRTAREALHDPPIPLKAPNNEFSAVSPHVRGRLRRIPPGKNAFNSGLPDEYKLNVKGATMSQIYRRLDPAKPSYTVTGSGGGGTHVYHWSEDRPLTNRERARLQTFPDDFEFSGSRGSVRKQIGMAVPVLASLQIHKAIARTILGVDYESVEANLTRHNWHQAPLPLECEGML